MSKHTPGPWKAIDVNNAWNIVEYSRGYNIADVFKHNGAPCNKYNARLIAAAPDLLAALEFYATGDMLGYAHDAGKRARAVIAKATRENT